MNTDKKILAKANKMFDAVGVTLYEEGSLLILGLATSPGRDLDDFVRDEDGVLRLPGFKANAQPKLNSLISFIQEQGLTAKIWGPHGYPQGNELNLKRRAVFAGLGMWGKNSLILHPRLGPRLRLMAVKIIGTRLLPTGPGEDSHKENPFCKDCNACVDACPEGILEPYNLRDRSSCRAEVSKLRQTGRLTTCDRCWMVCPVGR